MAILIKKAAESRLYNFDFSGLLATSEALTGSPTVTATPDGELTIGTPAVQSPVVQVQISDGIEGSQYDLVCVADSDANNTLQVDGRLLDISAAMLIALEETKYRTDSARDPLLADEELIAILNLTQAVDSVGTVTWDLNAAAAEGWRRKMAKAAGRYQFSADGQSFSRDQVIAQCKAMVKIYAPAVVA
jgi:hypothetical protein